MSCGHCTAAIEKALKAVDPQAEAHFDLANRTLALDTAQGADTIATAIRTAGYESEAIAA
jgi:copper chaperone